MSTLWRYMQCYNRRCYEEEALYLHHNTIICSHSLWLGSYLRLELTSKCDVTLDVFQGVDTFYGILPSTVQVHDTTCDGIVCHLWTSHNGCMHFSTIQPFNVIWRPMFISNCDLVLNCIWVRSRNCGCRVTWFCYQLIAKPGNKTATVPWPDPYV